MMWLFFHAVFCMLTEAAVYTSLHCLCHSNYQHLFWRKCHFLRRSIPQMVQMYKELQLLTAFYNAIHGGVLSAAMTICFSTNVIFSMYAVIGLYRELLLVVVLLYAVIAFDCFMGMVPCDGNIKSAVNNTSNDIMAKIRSAPHLRTRPIMRRYLRSWPTLKIKLGSTNFYDKETPLNLIGFCVGQVVSLLLF